MTFKEECLKLKHEQALKIMYQNQKTPPSVYPYGQSLRDVVLDMPYGAARQKIIKGWFKQLDRLGDGFIRLHINKRWLWNSKDQDLKALLKSGYLKIGRENRGRCNTSENSKGKRAGAYCSYLVLNMEVKSG